MKVLSLVGGLLLVVGIVGIVWGVIKMYEDRDTINVGKDIEIVVDDGDFPPIGVAGAAIAGVGLVVSVLGTVLSRKKN
jgi:hypothetical protein